MLPRHENKLCIKTVTLYVKNPFTASDTLCIKCCLCINSQCCLCMKPSQFIRIANKLTCFYSTKLVLCGLPF